jgi:hypothetical protein
MSINEVILLFGKQEDLLQGQKYIGLFLVLDNAYVSMKDGYFLLSSTYNLKVKEGIAFLLKN